MGANRGRTARFGVLACVALGASLAVAACSSGGGRSSAAPGSATAAVTGTPAATLTAGMAPTISINHIATHAADDHWKVDFDEPVVSGVPAAATMNSAIDAKVQAWITDFTSSAVGDPGAQSQLWLDGKGTVALISPTLLSLRFDFTEDTGGAHPNEYAGGIAFRVTSGDVIQFADLFGNPASALTVLNTQTQALLTTQLGDRMAWGPASDPANVSDAWALTTSGLELSWSMGGVADMATGNVTITIPWTEPTLAAVINPSGPAAEFTPGSTGGTPSAAPTATPAPATPTITTQTITSAAPDGSWTVTVKKPVVGGVPQAGAMNAAIDARVNAIITEFKTAESDLSIGPNTLEGEYSVALVSPTLLSLRFKTDEYTGGAHGSQPWLSFNFAVPTGAPIHLQDLFTDSTAGLSVLSAQSRTLLAAHLATVFGEPLTPDDIDGINGGTQPVLANFDSAWVFTTAGLEITFQEYQVAAYVAGVSHITIPWSALAGVISPTGPAAEFAP